MTINTDINFVPSTRLSLSKYLKRLAKWLQHTRKSWRALSISRHAPPLDNHLRRDIGLPDADPPMNRHLVAWQDPLNLEIRRKW
ncbi:MAG: hypothetical protein HRU27_18060 [Rhizobiaceae bacterium]|nr:hypothetical protein [Rhizobiaceae bacterium]